MESALLPLVVGLQYTQKKEVWPKIKRKAKKERAVILFEDETAVSLIPSVGKTWAKIGRTPIIKTTGNRGSISVLSAMTMRGQLYFKIPRGNVNAKCFVEFLKQLLIEISRKR